MVELDERILEQMRILRTRAFMEGVYLTLIVAFLLIIIVAAWQTIAEPGRIVVGRWEWVVWAGLSFPMLAWFVVSSFRYMLQIPPVPPKPVTLEHIQKATRVTRWISWIFPILGIVDWLLYQAGWIPGQPAPDLFSLSILVFGFAFLWSLGPLLSARYHHEQKKAAINEAHVD